MISRLKPLIYQDISLKRIAKEKLIIEKNMDSRLQSAGMRGIVGALRPRAPGLLLYAHKEVIKKVRSLHPLPVYDSPTARRIEKCFTWRISLLND